MNGFERQRIGTLCAVVVLMSATAASAANSSTAADPERGAAIAAPCRSCHGQHGEGMPAAGFPRLAGQQATYLAKELQDFASGSRANSVMSPIAQGLSAQHRADLAAYFESLSGPFTQPAKADVRALTRGAMLAATGDQAKQLQACGNCHGPEGRGETGAAPYLAGQSSVYIRSAIAAWRAGTRKNDDGQLMASVPARLDDAAATAAAAYYEALGPASQ